MRLTAFMAMLLVAGCAVGPDYHPPKTVVPASWDNSATNAAAPIAQWWKTFNDPELDSLIARAVLANHDLRRATARLNAARAQRGLAISKFGPDINAIGSYYNARTSKNSQVFAFDKVDTDNYDARFDASWEIDVFGGKRRGLEAATANLAASEADRRDVLVSLLAEVARNYVELRGFQRQLVITHDNTQSQQAALDLTRARFKAGVSSQLEVAQATALLSGTEAQVPTLTIAAKHSIHRLSVLLGQPPGALVAELSADAPIPATPHEVPVGLPSELLRRRPDIRRAERQLASATARIGVETAELFPKFTLLGTAGFNSLNASDWFTSGSRFWSAGPRINWRLLDFGHIHNQIRAAGAQAEDALALYEQTVLTALEETENALVAYAQEQVRRQSLQEQVTANRQAVELATMLYTKGSVDFLNVIVTKRALYIAEDALVLSDDAVATNLIALYKALGGGWEEFPSEAGVKR